MPGTTLTSSSPFKARSPRRQVRVDPAAAQLKQLGGKPFPVGKRLDDETHPLQKGRTILISLDSVVSIMEFENVQDVRRAFEQ
jgi:hypothetical protein